MPLFIEYIRQFTRFQQNARLYLICSALSGITTGIILVLYNLYLGALGYNTDFIGLALFVVSLGAGLMIFPAGIYVDRLGARSILIWASICISIAGVGQFLLRQPVPLLISDLLAGMAGAFLLVLNAPFLVRYSTPGERSLLFSFNIFVTLATTVLGELLGGFLPAWFRSSSWLMGPLPPWLTLFLAQQAEPRSYQFALLLAGIIAAPSFIPVLMMSNERPQTATLSATAREKRISFVQSLRSTSNSWRHQLRPRTIIASPLTFLILFVALISIGRGFFIPYFNLYFVKQLGASPALFGIIDGSANALNALFLLAAPWLAARSGRITMMTITRLLSIPLLLIIGLTSFIPLAALLYPLRQGFMDMSVGVFQAFFMEEAPPQHRGLANSTFQAVDQIAAALTTPLGGLIIANMGYRPVFIIGAVIYSLAIATLWFRFRAVDSIQRHITPESETSKAEKDTHSTLY